LTLTAGSADVKGFQYRFHQQGGPLPTYATSPFPIHWKNVGLFISSAGVPATSLSVNGPDLTDGPYDFQYSAQSFANLLEPRHSVTLAVDNTPPVSTIVQPQPAAYPHSATLTLSYSISDGTGSGVASFSPTMDGNAALPGNVGLQNGQPITLLTELTLGTHIFKVNGVDNLGNAASSSVTFTIIATPDSIKDDVRQFFQSGAIKRRVIAAALLATLDIAAAAQARGQCGIARRAYQAFINELQAQSSKGVDAGAAAIMIADAQYLIAHCP
jgi:hypothetical protein